MQAVRVSKELKSRSKPVRLANWSKVAQKIGDVADLLRRHAEESNRVAWEIGKTLVEIEAMVDQKTWAQVLAEDLNRALGAAARSKSWLYKAMNLYRQFPRDQERASQVGLGRMDRLERVKDLDLRETILTFGLPTVIPAPIRLDSTRTRRSTPIPTLKPVETFSVRQLGRRIDSVVQAKSSDDEIVSRLSRMVTRSLTKYAKNHKKDLSKYIPEKINPIRLEKAVKAFVCALNGWKVLK